jgi:putative NIF3 family GTP cyclohydrolase 1 type 2
MRGSVSSQVIPLGEHPLLLWNQELEEQKTGQSFTLKSSVRSNSSQCVRHLNLDKL